MGGGLGMFVSKGREGCYSLTNNNNDLGGMKLCR